MNAASPLALLIDAMIAFTLIESAVLAVHHRRTGRGIAPRTFIVNMVSGLCLMLALRCCAHEVGAGWIAACIVAAGVVHLADFWMRWQRGDNRADSRDRAAHVATATRSAAALSLALAQEERGQLP